MIAQFCVFDMGSRRRRRDNGGSSRKWPFGDFKALKYKDMASLLFVLIWSRLLLFGPILRYFRLRALAWPYEALAAPRFSHGGG